MWLIIVGAFVAGSLLSAVLVTAALDAWVRRRIRGGEFDRAVETRALDLGMVSPEHHRQVQADLNLKAYRAEHDLATARYQRDRAEARVKELTRIGEEHQALNGMLREQLQERDRA